MTRRLIWAAAIVLSAIGVVAGAGRTIFVADLGLRMDPIRNRMFHALGKGEPDPAARHLIVHDFDASFAAHRPSAWLHVIPGAAFLALAPLQFSTRLRRRYLGAHRWLGRILITCGLLSAIPAFYFGLAMPFGGLPEAVAIAVFGALFCLSLVRGFVAIRRHEVAKHREWMIRAYAIGVAISTIRLIGIVLDLSLKTDSYEPRTLFVVSLWTGWLSMIAIAELWLRATRASHSTLQTDSG